MQKTFGMDSNIAALVMCILSIFFMFIPGLVFFLVSKDKFVRFHSMQVFIITLAYCIISAIFFWLIFIPGLIGILVLVLLIVLAVKSYQNEKFKVPFVGDLADNWS